MLLIELQATGSGGLCTTGGCVICGGAGAGTGTGTGAGAC